MNVIDQYGDEEEPWEGDETPEDASEAEAEQLALDDGEEQLPWLESDEDYDDGGVDTARIVAFSLIGLLALVVIVGGIWWATRERMDAGLVADGSTIEAPEGPYKSRPDDPGGKTFAGTGDTSFAVAEGESREGKLAEEAPRPSIDPETTATEAAQGGVGVQVGAYSTRSSAEQGWSRLVGQYSQLQGVSHRIVEGQADIGTVYRLQAVAGNLAAANSLCSSLKAAGGACQVKP